MIYQFTIYPLECVYKAVYLSLSGLIGNYGLALISLSLLTFFAIKPLSAWAEKIGQSEKKIQSVMQPQLDMIKASCSGADRHHAIKRLYKRYGYHPAMAVRSAAGVLIQIPFLMAAYYMLSDLTEIAGKSFLFIGDLGSPDAIIRHIHLLPFVMTAVNIMSAFTMEGFTKKDRRQAVVIALLFLALLYTAPSALLIYWTCNNLWTLLTNLAKKFLPKARLPEMRIGDRSLSDWLGAPETLVSLAFALTVCVFVPADIYVTNANEIWFGLSDIAFYILQTFLMVFAVFFAATHIFSRLSTNWILCLVLGISLGVFVQSYVIQADYGTLQGNEIDWGAYGKIGAINTLVWACCLIFPFVLAKKLESTAFKKAAKYLSIFLIAAQTLAISYTGASMSNDKYYKNVCTTDFLFDISSKDNIIVFIIDTFDAEVFEAIRDKEPEVFAGLDGFTWYQNATSLFGRTVFSMPEMLTGKAFDNSVLFSEYIDKAWEKNPLYELLSEKNYDIGVYTRGVYIPTSTPIRNIVSNKADVDEDIFKKFMTLSLFREVPHYMKPPFLINSSDIYKENDVVHGHTAYSDDNVNFYTALTQNGLTTHDDTNSFRWYHLRGSHPPYYMTRDIRRLENGQSDEYEQSIGSLNITYDYFRRLKELGLYDNSTILILADHGHPNRVARRPLVLVKQPGETGELKTATNPVTFEDLHATIAYRFLGKTSAFGTDFSASNPKTRKFFIIESSQDLTRYDVGSDASDPDAWVKGGKLRHRTDFSRTYRLGEEVEFRAEGDGNRFIVSGFDKQDIHGIFSRWEKGKPTTLEVNIGKNNAKKALKLSLQIQPFTLGKPKDVKFRKVVVLANGKKIATWKVDKNRFYDAVIPAEIVSASGGNISFRFNIARFPKEHLGLFFIKMKIDEVK